MNVQTYTDGKYLINESFSCHKLIEKWIWERQFLKFEKPEFQLGKKSRKRNKLYCFHSKLTHSDLIIKVSEISKNYKFWRKLDLYITSLFKDYNYNSYIGTIKLQEAGVNAINPIAYWTYKTSWLNRKSYFLYEKVESDLTVAELCSKIINSKAQNKRELINAIADQCTSIVQKIHIANIRHGDPHGGNILTDLVYDDINNISVENIKNADFILIDNDRCTFNRAKNISLKRFYDLKCLTRFTICQIPPQELLQRYLGAEYRTYWWYVLCFWKTGGFNIYKRINYLLK